jgi:hypothetical protein
MVARTQPAGPRMMISFIRDGRIERRYASDAGEALTMALALLAEAGEVRIGDCLLAVADPEDLPDVAPGARYL